MTAETPTPLTDAALRHHYEPAITKTVAYVDAALAALHPRLKEEVEK